jgi:hypothetical protein
MNEKKFEQHLRRQPLRQVPSAWREEILVAADVNRRNAPVRELTFAAALHLRLCGLFWPYSRAWAGLAAVWVMILALNFATRETTPGLEARQVKALTTETVRSLKQREQLLADLSGLPEFREAVRPKAMPPRPHSERRHEFFTA